MSQTKFAFALYGKDDPMSISPSSLLNKNNSLNEIHKNPLHSIRSRSLDSICKGLIKSLEVALRGLESSLEDLNEKISSVDEQPENLKEMFMGKRWRSYVDNVKNRKKKIEKSISSHNHMINIIEDNLSTEDLSVAIDLIDLYFKINIDQSKFDQSICETVGVGESKISKSFIGETVIYRISDSNFPYHIAILERYDPGS